MSGKGKNKMVPRGPPKGDVFSELRACKSLGQKAIKLARRYTNTELKELDLEGSATIADTFVWTAGHMNVCAQGLDDGDRVGNSIKCVRLQGRFALKVNPSSTVPNLVTVAVILKKATNGLAVDGAKVWRNQGTPQVRNKTYLKDYDIIAMKHFVMVPGSDSAAAIWEFDIPLNLHTLFSGSSAALTDCAEGLLQLAYVSDQASNQPSLVLKTRVFYVDD
jgi:hypothetical protein